MRAAAATSRAAETALADTWGWTPDFEVAINGQDLEAKEEAKVVEVTYDDHVEGADLFTIRTGLVDRLVGKLDWIDDALFQVGNKVRVKMGYHGKSLTTMIEGEITAVEASFTSRGAEALVLQGYDRHHRLRRGRKSRTFQQMTDWEIAQRIAGEHGLSLRGDPTRRKHEHIYQNNLSDFDFLLQRARRIDYEVVIENTTLYFQRSGETRAKVTTLEWGNPGEDGLLSFAPRLSTINQIGEVIVRGWNPKTKTEIVGRARLGDETTQMAGSSSGGQVATGAFGSTRTVVVDHPVFSEAEAQELARARFNELSLGYLTGEGSCLGNPDIRAGKVIELKGLGQRLSGLYYVVSSTHVCGRRAGGYLTRFAVTRNAVGGGGGGAGAGAGAAGSGAAAGAGGAGAGGPGPAGTNGARSREAGEKDKTSWIEIKLVDETGAPVPGEKYRIELPDGSVREGVLGPEGTAWHGNLDPGTCKITFPDMDASEWRRV